MRKFSLFFVLFFVLGVFAIQAQKAENIKVTFRNAPVLMKKEGKMGSRSLLTSNRSNRVRLPFPFQENRFKQIQ